MPTEPPPGAGGVALRARTLIHRDDERIAAVATQLRPELPKGTSPDHAHYLAAVAVAVLDARDELDRRSARIARDRHAAAIVAILTLALLTSIIALVQAVLS